MLLLRLVYDAHPSPAKKAEDLGFDSIWYAEHPAVPVHSESPFPSTGGAIPENYSHFTSPIRRYADLLVHRAIKSRVVEGYKNPGYTTEQLGDIGQQISVTERRAEDVGRDVSDWYKCSYAEQFLGKQFVGRVMGVTNFGLFIQLEEIWVQGLMHVSNLGRDFFEFVPEQMSLVGEKSGQRFHLGQMVDVILAEVDVESRKIDLLPVGHRSSGKKRNDQRKGKRPEKQKDKQKNRKKNKSKKKKH